MNEQPSFSQNQPSALVGFTESYSGNPPWEIGKPQPPFVAAADQVVAPVLDAGCGTGNTSLFFAARGLQVTGIDFVEEAIRRARAKAAERDLSAEFLVKDAMTLVDWDRRFASVIDSGLFHVYSGADRQCYEKGLTHVVKPGGRLFLFSFSDQVPVGEWHPSGVSRQEMYDAFVDGWEIESLRLVSGEARPEDVDKFPKGDWMWFAIIRRNA